MNGDAPKNHTRFIVGCITALGLVSLGGGVFLTYKGYNAELLIGGGGIGAISGLLGMVSIAKPTPPAPDVTISGQPPKVEVTQPDSQPIQPHITKA